MAGKLTDVLVEKKLITAQQFAEAHKIQEKTRQFIGTILLTKGWIGPDALLETLGQYYQLPWMRLTKVQISPQAVAEVPLKIASHYKIMPLKLQDSILTVAISNPQDVRVMDELRVTLKQRFRIEPVIATEDDILQAQTQHYGLGAETVSEILSDRAKQGATSGQAPEDDAIQEIDREDAEDASVVKLVNQLILEAHNRRATDIHLEPFRGKIRLRYRIDGMLHNVDVPPTMRQLFPAIISRIKVLSNLNIVERRLPQDGRSSVKIGEQKIDLRVAVLPTPAGESVVIRILPNHMLLGLEDLGFRPEDLARLHKVIQKPHGLIFVTGPTGSGKTTTLYACLKTINTEACKIITVEDPIEYELDGATQVQVKPQISFGFAEALRSLLRHDPDVMMVGEVRDLETVELTVRIALTGHLVFSTMHTNDAVSALVRLTDMGVDPYLIVSSVECIIGQRLVRLLCKHCKPQKVGDMITRGEGCDRCSHTGFLGRSAIYEFLFMTPQVRELILKKAPLDQVRRKAQEQGMRSMREDGMDRVKQGLTSVDEILRVTQEDDER